MTLQQPEILFPDAELWLVGDGQSGRPLGALRAALNARTEPYAQNVILSTSVPSSFTRLVQVRRDGGTERGVFDRPRFGINVWAATEQDVANLTRLVCALLRLLPGDGVCVALRQAAGPSPIPDSKPRRYFSVEATLRGEPL